MTALELVYESDARCQLTVKTVRSREGLDPRGLPFDTTADLLSNFLSRADVVADPEHASDPAARRERYQRIQHAAGHAPSRPATVSCDGAPATGQRIDALGLAVLELPWHDGATVLCVGVPELVDRLVLHTATAEDLSRF
ncbi:hypothetical protein [Amycolatopsis sp. WGS_07]|uniref:hypothetical protein n=1 Tax=Amycolatopsis sp. WGS_07 TaxID=3076764 RepID=UPI003872AE9F